MAVVNNPARSYVNAIVSRYDVLCHPNTDKIPDIFIPRVEDDGFKENSLKYFSEMFDNPPLVEKPDSTPVKMTYAELNEEVITAYKKSTHTLSHVFVLAGILDPLSEDPARQNIQSHITELLVQDHLRSKKNYALDPMASVMLSVGSFVAKKMGNPEPLPQFADGKRHFYSQIFLEAYSRSSARTKGEIVALLKDFQPQLESRSFWLQRVVFKIEGTFNRIITNGGVKFGLSVAFGIGSYFAINKVIALSVVFFNSTAFAAMSSGAVRYMPVLVVQISSRAYNEIAGAAAYVASTRLYETLGSFVVTKLFPQYVGKLAFRAQATCYQWAFGPSARVQAAIAESLKICKDPKVAEELLEEGMKAYQVWMHLVEQGPQEGLFEDDAS